MVALVLKVVIAHAVIPLIGLSILLAGTCGFFIADAFHIVPTHPPAVHFGSFCPPPE